MTCSWIEIHQLEHLFALLNDSPVPNINIQINETHGQGERRKVGRTGKTEGSERLGL